MVCAGGARRGSDGAGVGIHVGELFARLGILRGRHHAEHEAGGAVEFGVHLADGGEVVEVVEGEVGVEDVGVREEAEVAHAEVDGEQVLQLQLLAADGRGGARARWGCWECGKCVY